MQPSRLLFNKSNSLSGNVRSVWGISASTYIHGGQMFGMHGRLACVMSYHTHDSCCIEKYSLYHDRRSLRSCSVLGPYINRMKLNRKPYNIHLLESSIGVLACCGAEIVPLINGRSPRPSSWPRPCILHVCSHAATAPLVNTRSQQHNPMRQHRE